MLINPDDLLIPMKSLLRRSPIPFSSLISLILLTHAIYRENTVSMVRWVPGHGDNSLGPKQNNGFAGSYVSAVNWDFSKCAMGRVKDFNSISNLQTILADEGFEDVKLFYLGGLWVMLEFDKLFRDFDLCGDERVVWVDIEGVSLYAWSRETFSRIGKKWGEMLNIEDSYDSSFGRKRVCIITKHPVSILESFKIIAKGKVFMVRAKELFTWNPTFVSHKEKVYSSDDDSLLDVEGVADTIFGDNSASSKKYSENMGEQHSEDPFELYDLLKQKKSEVEIQDPIPSFQRNKEFSPMISAKVMNNSQLVLEEVSGLGNKTKKEWVKELTNKNKINFIAIQETKMDRVSHMDVKFMWGNSNYDYVYSDSLGNSGGILCIWEESVFKKDYVTISDSFVAIYGTWIPNKAKILIVAIYAPQQPMFRRVLWDYMSILLSRWNGEAILTGDFNEVRTNDERRGSWFNSYNARLFNHFISSSGLVDIKMEGYAFTWSHPSANKMSKLDRFLISDGIISLFPSITALCLDRHLSDHRPILLCEVKLDFGPTPFRFYHSWFGYVGFDEMVEQTWRSFSHSDKNGMIRFKKKLRELKKTIRFWINDKKTQLSGSKNSIIKELSDIDKELDQDGVTDTLLLRRHELKCKLSDIKAMEATDSF
ncbi:RNA-directed DNA polymerase, eukaryota [Tanacetum coccineum]